MRNLIEKKVVVNRVNRGITLLLVLALMTIFSMLVVTFMIVTSAAKNMALKQAQALLDPKERELSSLKDDSDKAIETLLYGNSDSPIGTLSILENLYGNGRTWGEINPADSNNVIVPVSNNLRRIYWSGSYSTSQLGHVLTLMTFRPPLNTSLSSELKGIEDRYKYKSVLVKGFGVDGARQYIDVEKFADNDIADFNSFPSGGKWEFIINSPAFSGTGEGVDLSVTAGSAILSGQVNKGGTNLLRVFLPNDTNYGKNVMMNPDYTAPDHLTWFLAWYDINSSGEIGNIIPSFHRPQIIGYLNSLGVDTSKPEALRAATLRPLPTEHPKFTGSNPTATLSNLMNFLTGAGEWDVDNDNDGTPDSIWINAGLPQFEDRRRSTLKRTLVQPLIAVLIRDLDGLLNVNVHGNAAHLEPNFDTFSNILNSGDGAYNLVNVRGSGMGSAEVRLDRALGNDLFGRIHSARHINSSNSDYPASVDTNAYAGMHAGVAGMGRLYPDFWGFAPITFEPMGYRFFDMPNKDHYRGNPYMTNVYSNDGNPFSVDELEEFLRSQSDVDEKQFTHKLRDLFTTDAEFKENRYLITTHSSNIPAMSLFGGNITTTVPNIGKNYESLYARIKGIVKDDIPKYDAIVRNLPPEIRRGEKINLNKVTKMTLVEKSEFAHQIYLLLMVLCKGIDNDYEEAGINPLGAEKFQIIADRFAQWSVNLVDFIDADATMTPMFYSQHPEDYVDYFSNNYRNTYSKFANGQFDDAWTNRGMQIVFGAEENDLFITKTMATHNRGTADSKKNDISDCSDTNCKFAKGYVRDSGCTGTHDKHFDQIFKPEGSFFVELYRAGDPTRMRTTGEFYTPDNGLDLSRVNSQGEPVWRIAISKVATETPTGSPTGTITKELKSSMAKWNYRFQPRQKFTGNNPTLDRLSYRLQGMTDTIPERFIYFVENLSFENDPTTGVDADFRKRSFVNKGTVIEENNSGTPVKVHGKADTVLRPNNFFLIAPRVLTSFKSKPVSEKTGSTDKFGMPDGSAGTSVDLNSFVGKPQMKTMVAAIDASELADSSGNNDWDTQSKNILALGFRTASDALDSSYRGIGVNVSEQLPTEYNMKKANGYYPIPTYDSSNDKDSYSSTAQPQPHPQSQDFDEPIYKFKNYPTQASNGDDVRFVNGFGTIPAFRSIYLQRLADPNRQYHTINNPYITVDWSFVDLHVFTSEKVEVEEGNASHTGGEFKTSGADTNLTFGVDDPLYFNIREWGTTAAVTSPRPNIRDRSFDSDTIEKASEIGNEMTATKNYEPPTLPTDTTNNPEWGRLSHNYGNKHGATIAGWDAYHPITDFTGIPKDGFIPFPWNDSPLASTFELLLVHAEPPARFGYECHDTDATTPNFIKGAGSLGFDGNNRFRNPETNVGPYLNFFADGKTYNSLDLVRLLEYVHVPSRFINTNQPLHTMREPGKINLNTMTAKSWAALGGDPADYPTIRDKRNPANGATEFSQPFRSPNAANLVPVQEMLRPPVDTTLLGQVALLPHTVGDKDNLYTSMHHLIRLSEMTTTRSNVFAVWITTGYFRVDENNQLCEEIGTDDGTVERHRDFYIIDRSIPVGFIRGEKLNTRNVIIHKKSLE